MDTSASFKLKKMFDVKVNFKSNYVLVQTMNVNVRLSCSMSKKAYATLIRVQLLKMLVLYLGTLILILTSIAVCNVY